MHRQRQVFLRAVALATILVPVAARSQSTKAELFGTILDPAGLPVSSAHVELASTGTDVKSSVISGLDGRYHFFAVPAGVYRLTIRKQGFASLRRDGIVLRVGDRSAIDLSLQVGDAAQRIEVTAGAPLLEANRGSFGFVVDRKRVGSLPLDGRNFVPLIALSAGVSLPPGAMLPRVNGSRPRTSEYIYDGVSVLQPEPGQVAYFPIIDAIEEFRVEVNSYSAEYGRSNGGIIMVNQKSGSNDFHGTLFEFFRNEKLNARNLFAASASGAKPKFRRNQYGFVLGGPLRKNKTFFFGAWQGTRVNTGIVRINTVPLTGQKQGVFTDPIFDPITTQRIDGGYTRTAFPDNRIPTSRFDRAALAVVERYPSPNTSLGGHETTANNYRRVADDNTAQDQFDGRLDRYFGSRHRVFARYATPRDRSKAAAPLPDGSGAIASATSGDTATSAGSIAAEHSWTLTPASVNQIRFGYTSRRLTRSSLRTGRTASEVSLIPNIPLSSFSDALPTYDVVGFQQLGPPANGNAVFTTSVTQLIDSYSRVRGPHSIKAGLDIRVQRLDVLQPSSPTGQFQFTSIFTSGLTPSGAPSAGTGNSLASFLLGQVGRFSIDVQPDALKPRANISEFFIHDDWRASRNLSLSLGVRYTLNFPSTVAEDRGAVFNLHRQELDFLGHNGFPRAARDLEKTNCAPRAGLAFKLTNSFVIRSGYGLTWIEQAGITTPFTTPFFPFIQSLGQQSLDNVNPAFQLSRGPDVEVRNPSPNSGLGQGVFAVQRDNGSGYAQQWNLTLQKTFGQNWSMEAGYLGSKLTRLGVPDVNLNQLPAAALALGPQLIEQVRNPYFGEIPANTPLGASTIARNQLLRPFPRFTTVTLYRNNIGHSTYHSFVSRLEKRFSGGLTLTAAYTLSRLIDDAGAVFDAAVLTGPVANYQAADSFNKRLEKDVSTGNIPHVFSSGFVYELPFGKGWQLAGIVRAQAGSPLPVTQATNLNAFAGFGIQRPNRVGSPALPAGQRATSRWFDTTAFTQAPQFTIGNSSRNPVIGPGYRTADLMLGKTFKLSEQLRSEFRAEVFNVTNTPPLGNPNGSFGNAAFGSITTALDPRVFEFVIKLHF